MIEPPVIELNRLTKYYGKRRITHDVSLSVPRGCIYGFLGRNGMGKTTSIRIFLGLEDATRGTARVLGQDSRELSPETRARIGYLPEGHHVYGWMTVKECGAFQAAYYPKWNADIFAAVLTPFPSHPGDEGRRSFARPAGWALSRAHISRLSRSSSCSTTPPSALDPVARRSLLQSMLYVTRQADRTIFFSSHLLSDVERVADRIAVLDGRRGSRPIAPWRSSAKA